MYKIPGIMKTGKEIKIDSFKDYNIVLGTINNKKTKAVFLNISSWVEPEVKEHISYTRIIKELNKKIKQSLFNFFYFNDEKEVLYDRTIVDLDIRESGIRHGKKSFMNCEITLFLKDEIPINTTYMKEKLLNVCNNTIEINFKKNKDFKFQKRKKLN